MSDAGRFWSKVLIGGDGCWEWQAGRDKDGYGHFWTGKRSPSANRVAWELWHEQPIPEGLCVLHSCDNPPCVRPDHLRLGTVLENNQEREAKGRGRSVPPVGRGEANGRAKLSAAQVEDIRRRVEAGALRADLAREFGVSWTQINKIAKREVWAC